MFGVEVSAAKPIPESAVTTFKKETVGARMVAAIVMVKIHKPPTNTVR